MVAVIWVATGFHLLTFKRQLYEAYRQNSANLVRAFEQDVVHALHEVDWTLRLLRTYYARHDIAFDFAGLIRELSNADGLSFQYVVIGPDGLMVMSSAASAGAVLDLRDREHFYIHRDAKEDTLFVSKPILGKVTGKWSIQLTRRITDPDGSFGGVIVASVDPGYFSRLYDSIDVGRNGVITLVGLDGVIRSVKGGAAQSGTQSIAASAFFAAIAAGAGGSYRELNPLDGVAHVGSYLRVAGFPLIVSVGFSEEEMLAGYRRELLIALMAATGLSLLILMVVIAGLRNRAKLKATTHALASAEQLAHARTLAARERRARERVAPRCRAAPGGGVVQRQAGAIDQDVRCHDRCARARLGRAQRACRADARAQRQGRRIHGSHGRERRRGRLGRRSACACRQRDCWQDARVLAHIP